MSYAYSKSAKEELLDAERITRNMREFSTGVRACRAKRFKPLFKSAYSTRVHRAYGVRVDYRDYERVSYLAVGKCGTVTQHPEFYSRFPRFRERCPRCFA